MSKYLRLQTPQEWPICPASGYNLLMSWSNPSVWSFTSWTLKAFHDHHWKTWNAKEHLRWSMIDDPLTPVKFHHCYRWVVIHVYIDIYIYVYLKKNESLPSLLIPIGSMYAIYGNIYHQYTPNVSIYTIHGSYGLIYSTFIVKTLLLKCLSSCNHSCVENIWHFSENLGPEKL